MHAMPMPHRKHGIGKKIDALRCNDGALLLPRHTLCKRTCDHTTCNNCIHTDHNLNPSNHTEAPATAACLSSEGTP